MTRYGEAERFAARLRMLRERAGLSYETLAQKTGISRSSLHRYCSGSSVPQDYGAAHRVATVCGATPTELRELHRLWALADAAREPQAAPAEEVPGEEVPTDRTADASAVPAAELPEEAGTTGQAAQPPSLTEPPAGQEGKRPLWRGRRFAVVATVAAVIMSAIVARGVSAGSSNAATAGANDPQLLFSAACLPVVTMGEHDECTHEVQSLLRHRGADIAVDGDFGPQTLRRVTAFQVFAGITPNGVVAASTKKALYDSTVRMNTWSPAKVRKRIREVFTEVPDKAVAIADCQSFLDPLHILPNTNATRNWGLFQISDARLRELGGTPRKALDPEWNIHAAERLWSSKHDFHDWPYCERALQTARPTAEPSTPH